VEALTNIDDCLVFYDEIDSVPYPYTFMREANRSRVSALLEAMLGVDFFHRVIRVEINASDVEVALPQLKRLPYLQTVCVYLDKEREGADDEPELARKKLETERETNRTNAIEKLRRLLHIRVEAYHETPGVDISRIPVVG
jgi:hypothetical protein